MRILFITLLGLASTLLVIGNAFYQKRQFYPSVIYLTRSSASMTVLYLQAFLLVFLFGKLLRKIFFGQLRPAEMEHLVEKAWYAVTETCLAFTVFRNDFSSSFLAMFTLLLFLKCFHWLAEDRIDYMERSPVISLLFHVRAISLLLVLGLLDLGFMHHAYKTTLIRGATVQLVFGFEYTFLLISVIGCFVKYFLYLFDSRHGDHTWDNKAMFMLYADFVLGSIRLCLYILFVMIMLRVHTFPLFAVRPIYLSIRFFKKSLLDIILSRRAIRYMNTVFNTPTAEEIAASPDAICIICREDMATQAETITRNGGIKKLPCGHMFHRSCLRSWFQRQQTCPTCRSDVLRQAAAASTAPGTQAPPAAATPTSSAGAAQNTPGAVPLSSMPPPFPPMMPPFPTEGSNFQFPLPPFMPPLPFLMMPPFSMTGSEFTLPSMPLLSNKADPNISDEELKAMEGQSREAVQKRLEALERIKILLDAAVIQMNGYMAAVTASQMMSSPDIKIPTVNHEMSYSSKQAFSNVDTEKQEPSYCSEKKEASGSKSSIDDTDELDELNVIRKRRLERFASSTSMKNEDGANRETVLTTASLIKSVDTFSVETDDEKN